LPEKVLLEPAFDEACPARRFMIGVLYLGVGDSVRSGFRSRPRPIVEGFIARGDCYDHPDIRRWQERSRELLKAPDLFDDERWCGGGYARGEG
jgi:hypothetical protein